MTEGPVAAGYGQPTRHECHCGKSFLRREHLKRHQATHAQPSFACPICHRSFTRNDVLRRHITVHNSAQLPAPPRGRRACDACHENKTKCDGGGKCSLCTKRQIPCVYSKDRTFRESDDTSNQASSRESSTSNHPTPLTTVSPDAMQVDNTVTRVNCVLSGVDSVAPQNPVSEECARSNLNRVLRAISSEVDGDLTDPRAALKDVDEEWIDACVDSYLGRFHERWPILHASDTDDLKDNPLVLGTVAMIATWLQRHDDLDGLIFDIHELVAAHVLQQLTTVDHVLNSTKPWPYTTYIVAFLNAMFAFETGRTDLMPRGKCLLQVLVICLRGKGALSQPAVDQQEMTYFPGTFRPWRQFHHSRWTLLASCALKADVYMGLTTSQPPSLFPEELEVSVPPTFAFWNTWGLERFYTREAEEPPDRENCLMGEMARNPQTLIHSGILIEDVVLGLCGTYPGIWRRAHVRRGGRPGLQTDPCQLRVVSRQLETWKIRLESISSLWTDPVANSAAIHYLLKAYRGREKTDVPGWEHEVMNRITIFVLNARMLYHLLKLHLNVDVRSITVLALHSWCLVGVPSIFAPQEAANITELRRWAVSDESRRAIVHALTVLKAYETAFTTIDPSANSIDPIAHVALSTAATVIRGWFLCDAIPCICTVVGGPPVQDLDMNTVSERDQWVCTGGPVSVDGIHLCRCSCEAWMARFSAALNNKGKHWGMSHSISAALTKPIPAVDVRY